jgi:uncharacterized protein YxeA
LANTGNDVILGGTPMKKILLGLFLLVVFGSLSAFAHEPVDLGAYNSLISVTEDSQSNLVAEVKVQDRAGHPYNIKTYLIDRYEKTITLQENKLYDAAGNLKLTDDRRVRMKYTQNKVVENSLHDSLYDAAIKWINDEKKEKKEKKRK